MTRRSSTGRTSTWSRCARCSTARALPAFTTGRFRLDGLTDPDGRSILRVEVELRAEIEASAELCASYQQAILQGLQQVNSEFRVAYEAARGRIAVHVALLPFGTFRQTTGKHQYLARDCSTAPLREATNGGHATG